MTGGIDRGDGYGSGESQGVNSVRGRRCPNIFISRTTRSYKRMPRGAVHIQRPSYLSHPGAH